MRSFNFGAYSGQINWELNVWTESAGSKWMRPDGLQCCSSLQWDSAQAQATPLTLFSNPSPNIYNTTGVFIKVKTLRRLFAVYDVVHLRNRKETHREGKGREVLAIIENIWLSLIWYVCPLVSLRDCVVSRSALNIKFLFWNNLEFPSPALWSSVYTGMWV